mmetsp:Transcript_45855/g.129927  ORF Transcript_45855/g.129927 Transcript_45855/m.129927 type:complete len:108 (+) Transcript_45855:356-679(+)
MTSGSQPRLGAYSSDVKGSFPAASSFYLDCLGCLDDRFGPRGTRSFEVLLAAAMLVGSVFPALVTVLMPDELLHEYELRFSQRHGVRVTVCRGTVCADLCTLALQSR